VAPERVLPGIYAVKIRRGYVNAFIIADGPLALIDSGLPGQARTFLKHIAKIGSRPEDVLNIAVTHHHVDHTGSLAALAERTGAKVYVHPLDAPVTRGEVPVPGPNPKSIAGKALWPVIKRVSPRQLPPVTIHHEVQDGEDLPIAGGLRAIHTPGHTAGHVSYLWTRHGGVLFAGDAAANMFGRLGAPIGMFTEDMETARNSIRKIAALEFDTACFGHGGIIKGRAHRAFRRYVEKMAR